MIRNKYSLASCPFPGKRCQGGFTLPEVIIVIVIIAILATIAIPGFLHWLPNIRLKAAARELYSDMQQTKIQAIKQNQDWAIVFDTAGKRYYVCSDPGTDDDWTTVAGSNTIEKTVELAKFKSGVTYGSGNCTPPPASDVTYVNNVVVFNPRGTVNTACCLNAAGCFVYLDHEKDTDTIRAGTLASGIIMISRWIGSDWE